jgi:hypothetical protein
MNIWRIYLAIFATATFAQAAYASEVSNSAIRKALPRNFSYGFDHPGVLRDLGTISIKGSHYSLVYYEYDETKKEAAARGGFPHAAHRLIVLRSDGKLEYLGYYSVDKSPTEITGETIRFDYDAALGNSITFTDDGPPKDIRLDGEPGVFGK